MKKIFSNFLIAICIASLAVFSVSAMASAKGIGLQKAKRKALNTVSGAHITEAESDYENGKKVYEIKLYKDKKEYELTYRASNGHLIAYGWEKKNVKQSNKKHLSQTACKKLAKKKVPNASVLRIEKDNDDGISVYEIKMKKGSIRYKLKYHAGTGKLLEYKWEK